MLGLKKVKNVPINTRICNLNEAMRAIVSHYLSSSSDSDQADIVASLLFNGNIFQDNSIAKVAEKVTQCQNSISFNAIALLRAIDLNSSLNDSGVNEYASIGNPASGASLLVKRWQISGVRSFVNKYISCSLGLHMDLSTPFGEVVTVDYESTLRFALKMFGLTEKATRDRIQIAISGDGAAITTSTRTAGQCAIGIKIIDPDSIDPITKEKCFVSHTINESGDEEKEFCNMQSSNNCVVMAVALAKESRKLITVYFRDFFLFANRLSNEGLPARGNEPALLPMDVMQTADMSFQQKTIGLGGGCKAKAFFCHLCECNGNINMNLFHCVGIEEKCVLCELNGSDDCTHRRVNDEEEIVRKWSWLSDIILQDIRERRNDATLQLRDCMPEDDVDCFNGYDDEGKEIFVSVNLKSSIGEDGSLTRHFSDYAQHIKHTEEEIADRRITYDPHALEKSTSATNIDYILSDCTDTNRQFNANVLMELQKRTLHTVEREQRVEVLRKRLKLGYQIQRYRDALRLDQRANITRVFSPGNSPPCVLHFHMRTIEKIVQQILIAGLLECTCKNDRVEFVDRVSRVVNRDVFGRTSLHEEDKSGWRVPMSDDFSSLKDINLDGRQTRDFEAHMDHLIDVCLGDHTFGQDYVVDWRETVRLYSGVREQLTSRKHYDIFMVAQFQKDADVFMKRYKALTGRDGMTNYFHMLDAGHFAFFLHKYGNLYRLSQQGWENVNSIMKRSFHRNTQRGGCKRGTSKILPVFLRLHRAMMWRMGHLEGLFLKFGFKVPKFTYGKKLSLPKFENVSIDELREYTATVLNYASPEDIDEICTALEGVDQFEEFNDAMLEIGNE